MRIGRWIAGPLVAGLAITGLGAVAMPAQAAVTVLACSDLNDTQTTNGGYDPGIGAFRAGDVLRITATPPSPTTLRLKIGGAEVASASAPGTITYTFAADRTASVYAAVDTKPTPTATSFVVTCTPAASQAAPAIPDWIQAYGIFRQFEPCLDGWTNSWHEWAVPITGGWVCTRTIPSLG